MAGDRQGPQTSNESGQPPAADRINVEAYGLHERARGGPNGQDRTLV